MLLFHRIRDIISERKSSGRGRNFLSLTEQIDGWDRANKKMAWGIKDAEFAKLNAALSPVLKDDDHDWGFNGIALFYGFGDDGLGNADSVLSGKLAWEYAAKFGKNKTWQCGYIDFCRPKDMPLNMLTKFLNEMCIQLLMPMISTRTSPVNAVLTLSLS